LNSKSQIKRNLILQWAEKSLISDEKVFEALKVSGILPDGRQWLDFVQKLLLFLGSLSFAFSAVFFIAYNWDLMGRFAKFGLLEILIFVAVFFYWNFRERNIYSGILLLTASIFLGALLALFGQTYQTGADTWELFFNWALLILPWVVAGKFAALWVLLVFLLNLSIFLYFEASGSLFGIFFESTEILLWIIFLFNTVSFAAFELAGKKFPWMAERWAVRLPAVASGSALTFLMIHVMFEEHSAHLYALVACILWVSAVYFIYRKIIPDLFMLAGLCLSLIVIITSYFIKLIVESEIYDDAGVFLLIALLVIGMAAAAAVWLKKVYREQQK